MKKCKICKRECARLNKGMCKKHHRQFIKYGKCLDNDPRTRHSPNGIIIHDEYAEILLYNNDMEIIGSTLVNWENIETVMKYKWSMDNKGYAYNKKHNIRLHRLILNCPSDMVVDHINHNRLDNRKENLRICTVQENNRNKSNVDGVSWRNDRSKWRAYITVDNKQIYLGLYDKKEAAIKARQEAEIKYFGEFKPN